MGDGQRDEGRILLLSLAYALVAACLVLTATAASAVHLQRKRLLAVADAAAADAADAVDRAAYYSPDRSSDGTGAALPLSDASVRAAVAAYLERSGARSEVVGLAVGAGTGTPDGRTAEVVLLARLEPPWSHAGPVRLGGVDVEVSSRAVVRLR
ncbi:hypothetical protein NUM3379_39920 [Kineococcus sp. NUM-3379]